VQPGCEATRFRTCQKVHVCMLLLPPARSSFNYLTYIVHVGRSGRTARCSESSDAMYNLPSLHWAALLYVTPHHRRCKALPGARQPLTALWQPGS
jgi:hypothetical protein